MNRRGFLKGLGSLAVMSLVPKWTLAVTDLIESKSAEKGQFVNHMTIQRKSVMVTGGPTENVIFYKFNDAAISGYYYKS